eukprot:3935958-Amphidinium_carterae.1
MSSVSGWVSRGSASWRAACLDADPRRREWKPGTANLLRLAQLSLHARSVVRRSWWRRRRRAPVRPPRDCPKPR